MDLRWLFYVQNLENVVIEMICALIIWSVLMLVLKRKAKQIVSVSVAILSVIAVLFLTIYQRTVTDMAQISLIPFISFVKALEQEEIYRAMLMNIAMFLPLGLSLPFALSYKFKHCILISLGCALFISICVELIQYIFHIGLCETDDVIMNLIGASLGTLSFLFCNGIERLKSKHTHKHIRRY